MRLAKLVNSSARPFGLLLCNYTGNQGAVVVESVNAFHDHSRFAYHIYTWHYGFNEDFDFDLFDFIVIHYSIIPSLPGFISAGVNDRIRRFKGLKIQMIQDDYRMNSLLIKFIRDCGIDVVYTVAPPIAAKALYADQVSGLDVETYLTGYVSHWLRLENPIPLRKRSFDVGYRGRKYPYWFGQPVVDKIEVADAFAKKLSRSRFRHNMSTRERDRIYGRAWVDFLRNCRAIFGMESDIHYVDPHGYVHHWYDSIEQLTGKKYWDGKDTLQSPFFREHARSTPAPLAVIPPRVFEAIALRSANVLLEGKYSDVVEPWRHYIPLKKDLSNVEDVMRALRDEALLIDIISVSFAEIAQNRKYTYAGFADQIDRTVQRHLRVPVAIPRRVKEPKKKPVPQCLGQHNEEPELRRLSHLKAANKATGRTLSLVAEDVERVRKATATPFHYIENPNAVWVENSNELNLTRLLRRALAKCLRFVRFR
jgi:hypothetical protein